MLFTHQKPTLTVILVTNGKLNHLCSSNTDHIILIHGYHHIQITILTINEANLFLGTARCISGPPVSVTQLSKRW